MDPQQVSAGSELQPEKPKRLQVIANRLKPRKWWLVVGLVILLVAGSAGFYYWRSYSSQKAIEKAEAKINEALTGISTSFQDGDIAKTKEYAKEMLEDNPYNMDVILAVADLYEKIDLDEAKKYYARALEVYKNQERPDDDGKQSGIYYYAGFLAEKAGMIDQARQYYQRAVDVAGETEGENSNFAKQAKMALERLQ